MRDVCKRHEQAAGLFPAMYKILFPTQDAPHPLIPHALFISDRCIIPNSLSRSSLLLASCSHEHHGACAASPREACVCVLAFSGRRCLLDA